MAVIPYQGSKESKKTQVARMFNNIAPRYDFLNHLLSMGIDRLWRRRAIGLVKDFKSPRVLDIATGTGDLAIEACRRMSPSELVGLDLSSEMLKVAQKKVSKKGLDAVVQLVEGDSENLPFDNEAFDVVMVAFGVRNFENLSKGLSEIERVLKKNGRLVVLEFSKPTIFPVKQIYNFYFSKVLPFWGGIISRDKSAYSYLPESVMAFPEGSLFEKELEGVGLKPLNTLRQTFGVATIYLAEKGRQ